jgi:hypothetical protein
MKRKIAQMLSVGGHPLLTVPVVVTGSLFYFETVRNSLLVAAIITGILILPLSVIMYKKTQSGSYSNFDVSDQTQRKSWYFIAAGLLALVLLLLFVTDQSRQLRFGFLLAALLLVTAQTVNHIIKCSLHTALNIFLCFLIAAVSVPMAGFFLLFVICVAWSRITLQRHSVMEVAAGAGIGAVYGALLFALLY